jgi:hypothetical protein
MTNTTAIERAKEVQRELGAITKRMREIILLVKSGKATEAEQLELSNLNSQSKKVIQKACNSLKLLNP